MVVVAGVKTVSAGGARSLEMAVNEAINTISNENGNYRVIDVKFVFNPEASINVFVALIQYGYETNR